MNNKCIIILLIIISTNFAEQRKKPPVEIECGKNQKKTYSNDFSDLSYGNDSLFAIELVIKNRFAFVSRSMCHGECFNLIMLNISNCEETILNGLPLYNDQNDKLILHGFDIEAEFYWNGIRIYNLKNNKLHLEFDISPKSWGPIEPKWIEKNKIIFNKAVLNNKWKSKGDRIYLKEKYELRFIKGKWEIKPI